MRFLLALISVISTVAAMPPMLLTPRDAVPGELNPRACLSLGSVCGKFGKQFRDATCCKRNDRDRLEGVNCYVVWNDKNEMLCRGTRTVRDKPDDPDD
ncbi:Protein of unknown function [Pyronema omphalodes CBS 100304]|uniref:Extracellular membrane protein CFEM domain-containing protein n=1 Tax=Pyronema omphalodes (strain CBS 100304) TaxID=1076935 RepID=U4LE98_PYROM|nr:Protein of unknown function [Pyronema omphalodes CBS 100304]